VDRVLRHDGGEQRRIAGGAAGDEIARRDSAVTDAAVDRRAQFGELHVELRLANGGVGRGKGGLRVAEGLRALLEHLLGDGLFRDELLRALEISFGVRDVRFGLRQVGLRLVERNLERPLVDGEQEIALLHQLPVLEVDLVEIAGDTRAHFHRIHGGEAADIFVVVGNGAFRRLCHGHGRRRRRGGLLLRAALAAACDQSRKRQRGGQGGPTHQRK